MKDTEQIFGCGGEELDPVLQIVTTNVTEQIADEQILLFKVKRRHKGKRKQAEDEKGAETLNICLRLADQDVNPEPLRRQLKLAVTFL